MKPVTIIIIKFSLILAVALLVERYILFLSPFNIPKQIPFTQINVDGLALILIFVAVLITFQKKLIKINSEITILLLTLYGTIICFAGELIFQIVRRLNFIEGAMYDILPGIITIPLFCSVISFFIALRLRTKKQGG